MVCSQEIKNELLSIFPSSFHTIITFIVCEYYSEFLSQEIDCLEARKFMIDQKQNHIYAYDQRQNKINMYTVLDSKFSFVCSYLITIPNLLPITPNITTSFFIAVKDYTQNEYYLFDKYCCKVVAIIVSNLQPRLVSHNGLTYIVGVSNFANKNKFGFWYQTFEETKYVGQVQFVQTPSFVRAVFIWEEYGCVVNDLDDNIYTFRINSKTQQFDMIKQTCQKKYFVQDAKFGYIYLFPKRTDLSCIILNAKTHDAVVKFRNETLDPDIEYGSFVAQSTNYVLFHANEMYYLFDTRTKTLKEIFRQCDNMLFLQNGDILCFSSVSPINKPSIKQKLIFLDLRHIQVGLIQNNYFVYHNGDTLHLLK